MDQHYRIRIKIGGFEFEAESHDKDWVEEHLKTYAAKSATGINLSAISSSELRDIEPSAPVISDQQTINEFYKKYISSKSLPNVKIALLLVYYLENVRKVDSLSTRDLKGAFREISFPKYDKINFPDIALKLKQAGFLNKIDGNWKLTITGIEQVLGIISGS